jgi:hypothetical protein
VKDDPLLFQGELMKLKPGVKTEFQPRWIQITNRSLRYYKNRWTKNSALLKPLGAIPLEAIQRIQILGSDVVELHTACIRKEHFYFEIVLKEDFLPIYLDPYYDIQQLSLGSENETMRITLTKKRNELK